jgi:hypothetical protein
MIIGLLPALMMVVGALMYALSANPKLAELGRLLFLAGSIGIAVAFASKMVTLV